jgi:translocation and assembly module TamA
VFTLKTKSLHHFPSGSLWLLAALLLGGCGSSGERESGPGIVDPDSGISYSVELHGSADEDVAELLENALKLYTLAHRKPASKARLRRRAESDMEAAVAVLRSEGYYKGQASFAISDPRVAAQAAAGVREEGESAVESSTVNQDDTTSPEESLQVSPEQSGYVVNVTIEPGPRFSLANMSVEPPVTAQGLEMASIEAFGVAPGAPARAAEIVEAEARAVDWLAERGYPYAKFKDRTVVANMQQHTLSVTSIVVPGPRVRFGELNFEGLQSVQAQYLQSYVPWDENALYARSAVEKFQTSLFSTNLFDSVSVQPSSLAQIAMEEARQAKVANDKVPGGQQADDDGQRQTTSASSELSVPITVSAAEAKHRSVGFGARFSTDEGPEATAFVEHRNLFGANETGRATIIGGPKRQGLSLSIRKPQFWSGPNVLFGSLVLGNKTTDAFDERGINLLGGLEHRLNKRLTVSGGLSVELVEVDNNLDGDFDVVRLFGAPLTARYDASNSLIDPTRGYRLNASVTPYVGTYLDESLLFTSTNITGSIYLPLDSKKRYVFAARTRIGTVLGAERDAVPANKRLYSGGGGSVRGYQTQFIGPIDDSGDPIGGRSVLEAGVEMRIRVGENFGVVPFVDAGTVSRAVFPDFSEDVQVAAGLGVRYHTIIGPIRADVALPINPREEDNAFEFYISIGQAF